MASDSKNFQQLILEELLYYFDPLIQTEGDPAQLLLFFENIGWDFNLLFDGSDTSSFTTLLSDLITEFSAITEAINNPPDNFTELKTTLSGITTLINDFNQLPSQMPSLDGLSDFPAILFKKLFVIYLQKRAAILFQILSMLNIISSQNQAEVVNASGVSAVSAELMQDIDFAKIFDYLNAPADTFKTEFLENGFDTLEQTNITAQKIFSPLQRLLNTLGITAVYGNEVAFSTLTDEENERLKGIMTVSYNYNSNDTDVTSELGASVGLMPLTEGGPGVYVVPFGSLSFGNDIGNWKLTTTVSGTIQGFQVTQNGFEVFDEGVNSFELNLLLEKNGEDKTDFRIGSNTGTRLEIGDLSFNGGIILNGSQKQYFIDVIIKNGLIVLAPGDGDGFIQKILSNINAEAQFDCKIGWDNANGFHIEGSGALEIKLPIHIELGPITIENALISISPDAESSAIPVDIGIDFTLELGPFTGTVEEIGVSLELGFPGSGGNLGPMNFDAAFKPPTGLGLSIDAQGFKGGGFLFIDADKGEYSGGLELEFQDTIAIRVIGILNTVMPDGSNGFSLILIITAEFTPIQLGFGFTLNGVGGLIGINRTVMLDVLQTGVKDGSLNSILFPEDIVANATRIVSDIQKVFPVYENQYVFGPMAEIGWGSPTLITIQLGLIIELPDPVRLAILGVLKAILPDEDASLLTLQVNFLGTIDFDKKALSFDASLYNSKLLTFTLTGDMALRLNWGDDPVFLLSVGGFHPSYNPPANLGLGNMERLAINLFSGDNPRLRIETYFAVTSNTVQVGANGQLYVAVAIFEVEGYIGYDVLFQFSPFYFIANCSASLTVSCEEEELFCISLQLSLDGPTPWHAKGNASFTVLGFEKKVSINETFGDTRNTTLEPIDVMPLLKEAFQNAGNWQAVMPDGSNLQVTLKSITIPEGTILAHPCGELTISQKIVPLGFTIEKFGNQPVTGTDKFYISNIKVGSAETSFSSTSEEFAPAQFFSMTDAEKLSSKDFEQYNSGADVSGPGAASADYVVPMEVAYELSYIPEKPVYNLQLLTPGLFSELIKGGSVYKSKLSDRVKQASALGTKEVMMETEKFVIANTSDLKLFGEDYIFNSEREAKVKLKEVIGYNRSLAKEIQVVPFYEINL